jgi:hypothetical protein
MRKKSGVRARELVYCMVVRSRNYRRHTSELGLVLSPPIAVRIIPAPIMIGAADIPGIPSIDASCFVEKADVWIIVCAGSSIPGSPPAVIVDIRILKSRVFRTTAQEESHDENTRDANFSEATSSHRVHLSKLLIQDQNQAIARIAHKGGN